MEEKRYCCWCQQRIPRLGRWHSNYCRKCLFKNTGMRKRKGRITDHHSVWYKLAHRYLSYALIYGILPSLADGKTPCVDCGKPAKRYDHRDYLKPLAVEPVCVACNAKRGPAMHGEYVPPPPRKPRIYIG